MCCGGVGIVMMCVGAIMCMVMMVLCVVLVCGGCVVYGCVDVLWLGWCMCGVVMMYVGVIVVIVKMCDSVCSCKGVWL